MKTANGPKEGSSISVEPIRDIKSIRAIKKILAAGNARDCALFTIGINTAFRAGDLLALTVGQVRHLQVGDTFRVKEEKTGKTRRLTVNPDVHAAIQTLLADMQEDREVQDNEPLFQSRKGGKALTVSTLNNMVKAWCSEINLKGNYGSHTLRKTCGYQHHQMGTSLPTLMKFFGHASQAQTLHYLCIQEADVAEAFMKAVG